MKFHPTTHFGSVDSTLKSVTCVARALGVFPFVVGEKHVAVSQIALVWSVFLTASIFALDVFFIFFTGILGGNKFLDIFIFLVQVGATFKTIFVSLCWILWKRYKLDETLAAFRSAEAILKPVVIYVNFLHIICSFITVIGFAVVDITRHYIREKWYILALSTRYHVTAILIFAIAFEFNGTLSVAVCCFKNMNERLKSGYDLTLLHSFIECYELLTKGCEYANNVFGPQLLLMIVASFILITGNVYKFSSEPIDFSSFGDIAWAVIFVLLVFHLISICSQSSNEAAEFNKILYRITLDDKTGEISQNPKVVLHFSNRRKVLFTACGFFTIDFSLASSMIAAATTYLVILFQMGGTVS